MVATVNGTLQFAVEHGYAVLFVWVFAEQIGIPVPSIPFLLAVGALAGAGRLNFALALALGASAALLADLVWYYAGRRRGPRVLRVLCRLSFEPEACVRNTEKMFTEHGARSLLVAKFIPGLNLVAAPLAGLIRMPVLRFSLFDALGALLWMGSYAGLGYLFSEQLEQGAAYALRLNSALLLVLIGSVLAFMAWKYMRHQGGLHQSLAPSNASLTAGPPPATGRGCCFHPPSRPPPSSPSSLHVVDHASRG